MKSMDLLETIGSIRDKYILEAHSQTSAPKKRIPSKRLVLIAAIITLMLLLVGCAAVLLGLWDLRLGEYPIDAGFGETQSGEFISLSGFVGSKEYQANKEWIDFEKQYDPDGSIIASIGNSPTGLDEKYNLYNAYTQEMADKLNSIAEKYGLSLHSQLEIVDDTGLDEQVGSRFFGEGLSKGYGYIFEDGTFHVDSEAVLENVSFSFQLDRTVKGSMNSTVLNVGHMELYQESSHTVPGGDTLILAVGPERGLILGDFPDCFITMTILRGSMDGLTFDHLMALADSIDFEVLKNVKPPVLTEIPTAPTAAALQPEETVLSPRLEQYRQVLRDILEQQVFPNGLELGYDDTDLSLNKFAVTDIDEDGKQELLIVYTTTYYGGNTLMVYDYSEDTGELREELRAFPGVSFLGGGMAKANMSHNHSDSFNVWPYSVYVYDFTGDRYLPAYQISGWEKELKPDGFPEEVDADGDGLIYIISDANDHSLTLYEDTREYERWARHMSLDGEAVFIPWKSLTDENIVRIGVDTQNPEYGDQAIEKYRRILSGEELFFDRDQAEGATIESYCAAMDPAVTMNAVQYALADLDGDRVPELILWLKVNDNDYGTLVIRYENGGAVGYGFTYRQLLDLKQDGTFGYSGGVSDTGYARLCFREGNWEYDKIGYIQENETETIYFWNGSAVDADAYWEQANQQMAKENVLWNPYPAEHYDLDAYLVTKLTSLSGFALTPEGDSVPVRLSMEVLDTQKGESAYQWLLNQGASIDEPANGFEYIVFTLKITYEDGELEKLLFEENYPASMAQARVHFVLPDDDSNTTDVSFCLSNPIWNQTIPKGGAVSGQVAFIQQTGNTQSLLFEGYGQVISLE